MKSRAKGIAVSLAKFAVPVGIIAWLLWSLEPEQWEQLREQPKNYPLLLMAFVVASGAIWLSFVRWWILVRCQGIALSLIEALRLSCIGFLLSFVSPGSVGGDLFKAIFLAQRSPGRRIEAVASVVVDRGVGLLGLLLLVTAALVIAPPVATDVTDANNLKRISAGAVLFTSLGVGVISVLVLGGKSIDALLLKAARWPLVGRFVGSVASPLRMFHRHPLAFGLSLVISVGVHVLLAISIYMMARSIYTDAPTLAEHMTIVPIACTVSALPIAPAGMGLMEAAMEWLYRVIPAVPTHASGTLVALTYELVKVLLAMAGMVFYWSAGRDVRSSLQDSGEDPKLTAP